MPRVFKAVDMQKDAGQGWQMITLADAGSIGNSAMVARRWIFQSNAHGPETTHGDVDQLLFVIRGSGAAVVDGERLPLAPESVVWLEPGERYRFEAGEEGLEILQGYAPGEAK